MDSRPEWFKQIVWVGRSNPPSPSQAGLGNKTDRTWGGNYQNISHFVPSHPEHCEHGAMHYLTIEQLKTNQLFTFLVLSLPRWQDSL